MRSNVVLLSPQGGIPASSVLRRVAIDPPDPTSETRVEGGRLQSLDTVAAALSMSSAGTLYQLVDLANEALALDPHLASIAVRRFGTVASAPWELAPAKGPDVDKELAKELAEEATAFLETLPGDSQGGPGGFTQLLLDIMWATYHGRAASELVWEDPSAGELASIEWIHPRRIALDRNRMPYVDPRLADPPMTGWYRPTGRDRELVSLCDPRTRGKFIYATSRYFAEHPEREGLAYRSIYWAAFKRFGMRERMVLAETYAKPYKVIEVAEGASVDPAVLEQVMQEVEAAGSSTSTVRMPKGLTLRIEWPQEVGSILTANTEAVNEELSKLWLGQTMTTTDGSSRAQAEVHERQQNLIAFLDAELAQRVITEQVLKPRALMRGGEKELRHCPRLRLRVGAQADRLVESQVIEKAVSLGMQVSALEAHEKLGLRVPADGEEILGPPAQAAPALGPDGEPLPPGAPPPDGAPPAGPVTPPEDGPPAPGTPPPPKAGRKAEGGPPDGAVKAEAFGEAVALYDEDQPRDDGGRWTSGGGGGGAKPKVEAPARVRSDVTRAAQVARELAKGGRTSVSRADLVEGMGREPTNREWAAFRNEAKARQHLQVEAPEPKAAPAPPAPAPPPEPDEKPAKGDLTAKKGKGEEGASPRPAVRAPYTLPPAERYGVKPEDLELPAGWATTEERATERQRELDEQRGGPAPTPKAVSGTMAEGARAVRDNARALLRSYRSTLSGEEYSAARDWVDDTAEAFGEAFPEAEAADVDAIMRDAVDRLMVQHYESERRALTDHGLRHILGDIDNGRQILDALEEGGTKIDKGDRLASSLALALHDYGYLAPTQRGTFKNDAHPALSARVYEADNREAFARVLGDQRADWITHAIATHPFAAVDWEADPLTSALRTADNLSIFAPQKLPTLFTAIEGAVTDLKAMRAAKTDASFEVIKTRLTDRVAKAQNVSERQRSQLQKALGEVSRFTPKVMLSRLAGDLDGFTFGGGVLDVGIRYTEAASAISEVFHDRNADFLKFASDLGAAKEDLTDPAKVAAGVDLKQGGRTVIRIHVNDLPANILDAGADEALELAETPAS